MQCFFKLKHFTNLNMYDDKIMEFFRNPRNVGTLEDPSAVGELGNPSCGEVVKFFLKIEEDGIISEIKFQAYGSAVIIAAASAMTEIITGKTIQEAQRSPKPISLNLSVNFHLLKLIARISPLILCIAQFFNIKTKIVQITCKIRNLTPRNLRIMIIFCLIYKGKFVR